MTDINETNSEQLDQWREYIITCLGREPRGLRAIAAWSADGKPAVIQVAPLVDGKPFPTVFWLVDPATTLAIDRLEAAGTIAYLQAQVDASVELQRAMEVDHRRHRARRASTMTSSEQQVLVDSGMIRAFEQRGVGGIQDPGRIRCLHAWYAAHWVEPNTIGQLVDRLLIESTDPGSRP